MKYVAVRITINILHEILAVGRQLSTAGPARGRHVRRCFIIAGRPVEGNTRRYQRDAPSSRGSLFLKRERLPRRRTSQRPILGRHLSDVAKPTRRRSVRPLGLAGRSTRGAAISILHLNIRAPDRATRTHSILSGHGSNESPGLTGPRDPGLLCARGQCESLERTHINITRFSQWIDRGPRIRRDKGGRRTCTGHVDRRRGPRPTPREPGASRTVNQL